MLTELTDELFDLRVTTKGNRHAYYAANIEGGGGGGCCGSSSWTLCCCCCCSW
jgi:hypothetical protein